MNDVFLTHADLGSSKVVQVRPLSDIAWWIDGIEIGLHLTISLQICVRHIEALFVRVALHGLPLRECFESAVDSKMIR